MLLLENESQSEIDYIIDKKNNNQNYYYDNDVSYYISERFDIKAERYFFLFIKYLYYKYNIINIYLEYWNSVVL